MYIFYEQWHIVSFLRFGCRYLLSKYSSRNFREQTELSASFKANKTGDCTFYTWNWCRSEYKRAYCTKFVVWQWEKMACLAIHMINSTPQVTRVRALCVLRRFFLVVLRRKCFILFELIKQREASKHFIGTTRDWNSAASIWHKHKQNDSFRWFCV